MNADSTYEQRYKQTVVSFFDGRTSYDNDVTIRRALPLLEMIALEPGQRVLDIATGTGIIAIAAAQAVGSTGRVTGVDFSAGMLQQARQKSDELKLRNITWLEADADYLTFEDASFDYVLCSSALVYLGDISKALQDWYRWLKPKGKALFSGWSDQSYPAPWIIQACDRHGVALENINAPTGTPEKCRRLMEFAGFKEITIRKQQLGQYRSLEQLIGWNGTWFHPQSNPLSQLSEQQLQAITADYSQWLKEQPATNEGLWCESLAYFVAGSKLS